MRNLCEKHHLTYTGVRCPMCEKERIASFKVSKNANFIVPGQASRESYFNEYRPPVNDVVILDYDEQIKPDKPMTDSDMMDLLASKFGNVTKIK